MAANQNRTTMPGNLLKLENPKSKIQNFIDEKQKPCILTLVPRSLLFNKALSFLQLFEPMCALWLLSLKTKVTLTMVTIIKIESNINGLINLFRNQVSASALIILNQS